MKKLHNWPSVTIMFFFLLLSACGSFADSDAETEEVATEKICPRVWTNYYSSENNYLSVKEGGSCLNASRLIIRFIDPVKSVTLSFAGASTTYVLQAYDDNGSLLGMEAKQATFDNGAGTLFTISYTSASENIKSIQFGGPLGGSRAAIAVRELTSSRAGAVSTVNFEAFPDGTVINGDTQNTQGQIYLSLTGDEFIDWGFRVSTDYDDGYPFP